MHSWQPFSTAPKTPRVRDRGPLILAYGERGMTICYWQYNDPAQPGLHGVVLDPEVSGWWVDPTVIPSVPKAFTHWMPLPEKPEA